MQMTERLNPLTLQFDEPQLERHFRADYRRRSMQVIQVALYTGIVLNLVSGLLDAGLFPQQKIELWTIRYGVVVPFFLLVALAYHSRFFVRVITPALFSVFLVLGGGVVAMLTVAQGPRTVVYFASLMLVLVYGFTLLRLPFVWVTVAGALILLAHEAAATLGPGQPAWVFVSNTGFLVGTTLLGTFAAYSFERAMRLNFVNVRRVERGQDDLQQLNSRLHNLSITDPLTGLFNRRHLKERMAEHIALYRRYGLVTSLILLDLDGFKQVNDTHGHDVGDRLLVAVSDIIRSAVRDTDMTFRLGGDEFCLMLTNTPLSGAEVVAERLLTNIKTLRLDGVDQSLEIGLSGGCTATHEAADTEPALFKIADTLLYQAKGEGKGRIIVADAGSVADKAQSAKKKEG
jgi:diguanylate cyclase (GGDEF)-like protein